MIAAVKEYIDIFEFCPDTDNEFDNLPSANQSMFLDDHYDLICKEINDRLWVLDVVEADGRCNDFGTPLHARDILVTDLQKFSSKDFGHAEDFVDSSFSSDPEDVVWQGRDITYID
jgi:hypothetical protein